MKSLRLVRVMSRVGRMAEPDLPQPQPDPDFVPPQELRGTVQVRHVDAGSCNGCEVEIGAVFGPVYDAERYGARLVASPRHADALLVTGVVTKNMTAAVQRTVEATPRPRVVIAVGECARTCGEFAGSYAVAGSMAEVTPVDLEVPGCPPEPEAIIAALRKVTQR